MRWFLLPCEAQDYLRGATPASCRDYVPKFFPGKINTISQSNPSADNTSVTTNNGFEARFETMNFHYCSCTPYRTEYTSRVPAAPSFNVTKQISESGTDGSPSTLEERPTELRSKLKLYGDEKPAESAISPQEMKNNNETENSENKEQCTLLCKPVPKRTLTMKAAENDDTYDADVSKRGLNNNLRFHNPPKEIFKPAVEVGIENKL